MKTAPIFGTAAVLVATALAVTLAYGGATAAPREVVALAPGIAPEATASAEAARYRDFTIPAGTVLPISLDSYVASDTSRIEDPVRAHVRRAVIVNGATLIPAGSTLSGYVTSVERAGRVKGRGRIAFRFTRMTLAGSGERVNIRTTSVARLAPATKRNDALKIGVPAAGGAVVGALAGGKKGAAIGAAAGGGAGTAVVLSTRGREARLGRGALVSVRLVEPATVRLRV